MAISRFTLDTSAYSVASFAEVAEHDRACWMSLDPQARLAALEEMRQINYGYDPDSDRIQRTAEVAQRS